MGYTHLFTCRILECLWLRIDILRAPGTCRLSAEGAGRRTSGRPGVQHRFLVYKGLASLFARHLLLLRVFVVDPNKHKH